MSTTLFDANWLNWLNWLAGVSTVALVATYELVQRWRHQHGHAQRRHWFSG